jgi:DNA-binding transcriptional ArsR family regulator
MDEFMDPPIYPLVRNMSYKPYRASSDLSLMEILQALADPIRLEIVRQLDESGPKACGMFGIDMPKSSLSHHFRILRESGVIVSEGQGTVLMNRLRREEMEASFPGLIESILEGAQKEYRAPKISGNS